MSEDEDDVRSYGPGAVKVAPSPPLPRHIHPKDSYWEWTAPLISLEEVRRGRKAGDQSG
jgi:hypothetical protein